MARLLRDLDYLRLIQEANLDQIVELNEQIKLDVEQAAQAEMISYLTQRYLIGEIFTNTTIFDPTVVYYGRNLVYLDAPAYNATLTYAIGALTLQVGNVYSCNTLISVAEPFTVGHWTLLGAEYAWFNAKLPQPEYDSTVSYIIGQQTWYMNNVYTCLIPNSNVLPTTTGFWSAGVPYSFSGILPTNTTNWATGDNRNQLIVLHLINITLYYLHFRINPRLIPDHRKEAYNGNSPSDSGGAIGWLKRCASGNVTADLPAISPVQGLSIRYGNANSNGQSINSPNFLW